MNRLHTHTDTMIYKVWQNFIRPKVAVFHYYGETDTTLGFSLSTINIEFKRKDRFLFYDSDLIILYLGLLVPFIG